MSRIKGTKSSAALIVAVIALVAALGGGAVAGVTISKLSDKERKQVKRIAKQQGKKQANRQIKRKEPELNVRSAESAVNALNAQNATSAQSAETAKQANGVRPVKVNFTAESAGVSETLVDEGGIRLIGACDSITGGVGPRVTMASTADDGAVYRATTGKTHGEVQVARDPDFDEGDSADFSLGSLSNARRTTIDYLGADGSTVTGALYMSNSAALAGCVITGTLFVG